MIKIKITYRGQSPDGWGAGCLPVYVGVTNAETNEDLSDNPEIVTIAKNEIRKMIKNCGEFANTLVRVGETGYTFIFI